MPSHPKDQQIRFGADKALASFTAAGWVCLGYSWHEGLSAGYEQPQSAIELQRYTLELFPEVQSIFFNYSGQPELCYQVNRMGSKRFDRRHHLNRHDPEKRLHQPFTKNKTGLITFILDQESQLCDEVWLISDFALDANIANAAMIEFCPAIVWRERFTFGVRDYSHLAYKQIQFLESGRKST